MERKLLFLAKQFLVNNLFPNEARTIILAPLRSLAKTDGIT